MARTSATFLPDTHHTGLSGAVDGLVCSHAPGNISKEIVMLFVRIITCSLPRVSRYKNAKTAISL